MKDLTTAQWELYRFLKTNYSDNKYISKQEICQALPQYYEMKANETRTCRDIEFDVRIINANPTIQKIIVSNAKGYKLGTQEQVTMYLQSRLREAKRSLAHTYKLIHKAELNNQFKITFGKNERNVIETYVKQEEEENNEDYESRSN